MAKRREFSRKVKLAAFKRAKGKCEKCGMWLHVGRVHYDHVTPDGLGGEPTLENCAVLCKWCHGGKTAKHDVPMMAKADRLKAKHIGAKPKRPWGGKFRKLMSGEVVLR